MMNLYHLPAVRKIRHWARRIGMIQLLNRMRKPSSYEESFAAALRHSIIPGDVIWDIGANVGFYSRQFAEWTGELGKVVAFEPLPAAFLELQKTAAMGGPGAPIETRNEALAERTGLAMFDLGDTLSGVAITTTAHLGDDHSSKPSGQLVEVYVNTIDEAVGTNAVTAPTVTKIDVEGFEEEVLLGGAATFSSLRSRHVFIEVHFARLDERNRGDAPGRIVRMLKSWGYQVRWADPSHLHASRLDA
jgi:FkbM family methyltransferase